MSHLLGQEDKLASGCLHVGTLRILGSDERVTSDVPVGSEIEVQLKVDESRTITAVAYIPLLDEQFEIVFVGEKFDYEIKNLQQRLVWAKEDLAEIEKIQSQRPVKEVGETLEAVKRMKLVESVSTDLERALTEDRDSEVRAYKRMLEIEGTVRALLVLQRRPRIENAISGLAFAVQGNEQATLNELEKELSAARSDEDMERIQKSLQTLEFAVRGRPYQNMLIDLDALDGQRVTQAQLAIYNEAQQLVRNINQNGGLEKATDADISALQRMHNSMADTFPKLYELREKMLDEMAKGHSKPLSSDTDIMRK